MTWRSDDRQLPKVVERPGIIDDPVLTGQHQQRPAGESGRDRAHQPVDDEAGGHQAGGPLAEAERVGGDEGLALRIGREERRVGQGDRERLATVGEERPGDPEPLLVARHRPDGEAPGQIGGTASTRLGVSHRDDHRELAPQLIPARVVGNPGSPHAVPGPLHEVPDSRAAVGVAPDPPGSPPTPGDRGTTPGIPTEASVRPSR